MSATGARRRARGYALQMMYALDAPDSDHDGDELDVTRAVAQFWRTFEHDETDDASVAFAEGLVRAAWVQRAEIDAVIQQASRNWRLERMSRVDRNILRLASHELMASPDVPLRVVINEAIELAKRFGADESPAFVNGILDRVAQSVGRE